MNEIIRTLPIPFERPNGDLSWPLVTLHVMLDVYVIERPQDGPFTIRAEVTPAGVVWIVER